MEKRFINELKVNEQVDSFFILNKKELKLTKYDKPYLQMTLSDRTGRIEARLWDDAEKYNESAETGDVVWVKGTVDKFREEKQLKIGFIAKADERAFRFEDMVRVAEHRDVMFERILKYLEDIKNKWIKMLVKAFTDDEVLMSLFRDGLGGKSWHGAYIGGLLEHTYEVMYIVDHMCRLYPDVDRYIAVFGSFIHDIGKVYELDARKMEYTVEGGLIGHIGIGHKILMDKINSVSSFSGDLSLRLEHIILSHHGKYEQQSPVLPKTLEATIIYQTDELVSQANAVKEIQLSQMEEGKAWSTFVNIKNRKYYIKDARGEEWIGAESDNEGSENSEDASATDDLFK